MIEERERSTLHLLSGGKHSRAVRQSIDETDIDGNHNFHPSLMDPLPFFLSFSTIISISIFLPFLGKVFFFFKWRQKMKSRVELKVKGKGLIVCCYFPIIVPSIFCCCDSFKKGMFHQNAREGSRKLLHFNFNPFLHCSRWTLQLI